MLEHKAKWDKLQQIPQIKLNEEGLDFINEMLLHLQNEAV